MPDRHRRALCALGGLAALLLATSVAYAQSEEPVDRQHNAAAGERQDNRGAAGQPALPKGNQVGPEGRKAAEPQRPDYEQANLDVQGRIADYTEQSVQLTNQAVRLTRWAVFLTFAEALLFVITTIFTVFAVIQAKRSADIAERTLTGLEMARPSVFIEMETVTDAIQNALDSGPSFLLVDGVPSVRFFVKNNGRSAARLVDVIAHLIMTRPNPRAVDVDENMPIDRPVLGEGERTDRLTAMMLEGIDKEDALGIQRGTHKVHFTGWINHLDPWDGEQTVEFAWLYSWERKRFDVLPPKRKPRHQKPHRA